MYNTVCVCMCMPIDSQVERQLSIFVTQAGKSAVNGDRTVHTCNTLCMDRLKVWHTTLMIVQLTLGPTALHIYVKRTAL